MQWLQSGRCSIEIHHEEEIVVHQGGEAEEQIALRSSCGSKPGGAESKVEWGLSQAVLVEYVPAHSRCVGIT